MKKLYLLTLLIIMGISAKSQTISGKIIDATGQTLPDAYILSNKNIHSHTDAFGAFKCDGLAIGDTITVSYLGFKNLQKVLKKKDFQQDMEIVLEESFFDLDQVYVSNAVKSINKVTTIDLKLNPVNSSQEILRSVPGLFIGQHAGGGKAEQIFLRGFDIDHGTDIHLSVDGLPVNMVSHAHGQGYADLHFLIPELIQNIDFGKGPYYADKGNFTTAGYVNFKTKDQLEESRIGLELGQFNTLRTYGLFDLMQNSETQNAYIATEYLMTDGPVESPQNFNRFNVMSKYTLTSENDDRLSVLFSTFRSKWDASGQIPQRLVDAGVISRLGYVDNTEGGQTNRTNIAINHSKTIERNTFLKSNIFYSNYNFELFSNFTFFLEDSINGDQIKQRENRNIFGFESSLFHSMTSDFADIELQAGAGLRIDDVDDNELAHTANRKTTLNRMAFGDVNESNVFSYVNAEFDFGNFLINPGLRVDFFNFDYADNLKADYSTMSQNKLFLSPKLNFVYNPSPFWQLFLKTGIGFHSNDARVVVAQEGEEILPAAYGADLGTVWKPAPRIWVNTALWYLFLEQEFVYVGDAGIVEPSGKTTRRGIDIGLRAQISKRLFFDTDFTYTYARAIEGETGEQYIPLAPVLTSTGGLSYHSLKGFSAGMKYRYIMNRPANENNSIIAKGYFLTDLNASYDFKKVRIGFAVENLFNAEWNEAQFATESRLKNETASVEEIHFTPGTPFFLKGKISYKF